MPELRGGKTEMEGDTAIPVWPEKTPEVLIPGVRRTHNCKHATWHTLPAPVRPINTVHALCAPVASHTCRPSTG